MTMTRITMYTDGAARGNPDGPGGYGTILSFVDSKGQEHIRELSAGYQKTTNNRMEMMAGIAGNSIQIPSISSTLLTSTGSRVGSKRAGNAARTSRSKMLICGRECLRRRNRIRFPFSGSRDITDIRRMSAAMSWQQRQPTEPVFWLMRDWSNRIAYSQKNPAERQRKRRKSGTS